MIQTKTIIPVLKAGDYIKIKQRPNFRDQKQKLSAQLKYISADITRFN
jgi:hypothetical protein